MGWLLYCPTYIKWFFINTDAIKSGQIKMSCPCRMLRRISKLKAVAFISPMYSPRHINVDIYRITTAAVVKYIFPPPSSDPREMQFNSSHSQLARAI